MPVVAEHDAGGRAHYLARLTDGALSFVVTDDLQLAVGACVTRGGISHILRIVKIHSRQSLRLCQPVGVEQAAARVFVKPLDAGPYARSPRYHSGAQRGDIGLCGSALVFGYLALIHGGDAELNAHAFAFDKVESLSLSEFLHHDYRAAAAERYDNAHYSEHMAQRNGNKCDIAFALS